ncbi:probable Mitochondrial phosphate carrier protein 2 [Saccharomycodes ludwigii]|uniref:Probable Mitochondrial phosphate carrier protein 2 n=1 Tax=Saccharomycodes ludwigii TaxID=36035 RepID=A0A376B946_9ASCO|nr:hypothetical protein SCDLUD_000360 [Saccharomycodes ludwigii]KAH3902771.1 hypothetical protein SCDLUD_000360 [Saccharomycodes ludwigii]SSD61141.1 probable Mitochondrial phosphate carrier protein 2 [Saccharomycodes ludwigii]
MSTLPKTGNTKKVELYTPEYYALCTLGGLLACGPTHSLVCPLDVVKCRLQVDRSLYKGNFDGFKKIFTQEGLKGLYTGVKPTAIGYSFQGATKYGGYEFFKHSYAKLVGEDLAFKYRTSLYLAASASAEFLADILLCPFEAVKVKQQTTLTTHHKSMGAVWKEMSGSLYRGIAPLWTRQIPYTMCKFTSFERIVEAIYDKIPTPKSEMSSLQQTGVSFVGGYLAGILCAIVSHPADVMVSKINAEKLPNETTGQALGRIYGKIGFVGLWNGLFMRIFMIGTLTSLQWLIYDSFKVYVGLPTTGGSSEEQKEE